MIINDAGRKIIEEQEGLSLKAYPDARGRWTIGYGHTGSVKPGDAITQHQAEVIFEHDLAWAEKCVEECCPKANANQFSAMVSLCFNIGATEFRKSTLVEKFNAGDIQGAADEFPEWKYCDGKVLEDLVKRRAAERRLFLELPA